MDITCTSPAIERETLISVREAVLVNYVMESSSFPARKMAPSWLVLLAYLVCVISGEWLTDTGGSGRTVVPSSRVVVTRKGSLRGLYLAFEDKQLLPNPVELFLGVPYASPPVGSLRFMPPVTVSPWRGVRSADKYGPVCPQQLPVSAESLLKKGGNDSADAALKQMPRGRLDTLRKLVPMLANQSEDCLYLNIFTPYSSEFITRVNKRDNKTSCVTLSEKDKLIVNPSLMNPA